MKYLEIAGYIVPFWFALGFTYGVLFRRNTRIPYSTPKMAATTIYWWLFIGLAMAGYYKVWHLYWLMPIAFAIMLQVYGILRHREFDLNHTIFFLACLIFPSVIIVPILAGLIYFSA